WHSVNKTGAGPDMETHLEQFLGNSRFTLRLLRSGALGRFTGYDAFIERFNEVAGEQDKLLAQLLTEEAIRSPLSLTFDILPRRRAPRALHVHRAAQRFDEYGGQRQADRHGPGRHRDAHDPAHESQPAHRPRRPARSTTDDTDRTDMITLGRWSSHSSDSCYSW